MLQWGALVTPWGEKKQLQESRPTEKGWQFIMALKYSFKRCRWGQKGHIYFSDLKKKKMFWKPHLKAASWMDTVVLSFGDLSLVPECDRVSSPVLSQQFSNQPFRLRFSVLADTHSSRCREVIRDFTWPRNVPHPLPWTPQFREDAGGFWYVILIKCVQCSGG